MRRVLEKICRKNDIKTLFWKYIRQILCVTHHTSAWAFFHIHAV